jgi:hypothetical protein
VSADGGPRRVVLSVPGLAGPPVGGGCCAVGRDDVLLEEIDSWPGLLALDVDPVQGVATVLVTPGHDEDLTAALDALADRGLDASVLEDHSSG